MVWDAIAFKDKETPSLVGLIRLPTQKWCFHSQDPEWRWKDIATVERAGGAGREEEHFADEVMSGILTLFCHNNTFFIIIIFNTVVWNGGFNFC